MYGCIDATFVSQKEFDCVSWQEVIGRSLLHESAALHGFQLIML
jgi:hypothetical protein